MAVGWSIAIKIFDLAYNEELTIGKNWQRQQWLSQWVIAMVILVGR